MRRGQSVTTDLTAGNGKPAISRRAVSPVRGWIGIAADTTFVAGVATVVVAFYVGLVALVIELWTGKNDMSLRVLLTIFAAACSVPLVRAARSRIRNRHPVDLDLIAAEQLEAQRTVAAADTRRPTRSSR